MQNTRTITFAFLLFFQEMSTIPNVRATVTAQGFYQFVTTDLTLHLYRLVMLDAKFTIHALK